MNQAELENQFKEKLRELFRQHETISSRYSQEDFVNKFQIQYKDGRPHQPVGPDDVDTETFQKVMAAFNDVYP